MIPLEVTAHLRGAVRLPSGSVALDALLAAAIAKRDGLPPVFSPEDCVPIEIPVAREPKGRFHLASVSHGEVEEREHRWLNRRFPLAEAQAMGDAKLRRIQLNGGPCKSYRLPIETVHLRDAVLRWWAYGEREPIEELLSLIGYVGARRATGLGRVEQWTVESCEPWEGFPILRDGQPLRPLPPDWPGLAPGVELARRCISYPYHWREREEICAVPL